MNQNEILMKYLMSPAMSGMVGMAVFYQLYGNTGTVKMGPMQLSAAPAFGLSVALGDVLGTIAADAIADSEKVTQLDTSIRMLVKPAITGVTTLAVMTVAISTPRDISAVVRIIGMGAASEVGGTYMQQLVMGATP